MNQQREKESGFARAWVVRRADQVGVAVSVLAALAATIAWWISQGGLQGRLIEVDRAEPLSAAFQVDINTADWPELAQLPGVGETLARRIVESRNAQGPFRGHGDLRRVRGVGPATLEQIRPYLRPIAGDRTLAGK